MKERTKLLLIVLIFMGAYYIPWDSFLVRRTTEHRRLIKFWLDEANTFRPANVNRGEEQ